MFTNSIRPYLRLDLLMLLLACLPSMVIAQNTPVSFSNKSNLLPVAINSGAPMGIADMNGDGKDDIIHLDDALILNISYQHDTNQPFTTQNYGQLNSGTEWALCIADVDKNGFNDILAGGNNNSLKLLTANAQGQFITTLIGNSNIFVQGINFVDIDKDNWVDIFACSDLSDSRKYQNDGAGNFTINNSLINTTSPPSDHSGNYSSLWTDYDNDGDLDMYLSKCRLGVTDPTDLRRVNKLLQNDGNNVFTDVAGTAGLQIGAQTWTADFADIDNDGDLDVFVNNHEADCNIFLNNGNGTFTDHTAASGILPTLGAGSGLLGIQAFFRDFNNDGFVDLFYTGSAHYLFYNDGDGTFSLTNNPFNSKVIHSCAVGDLNHDGFLDIYAGHGKNYNSIGAAADELFINDGNSNHFVVFELEGATSDVNGIGARVEIYGAWGKQIREVRSGEGYGVMNSFSQHFGLGNSTVLDSVIVRWPSGIIDKRENLAIDQFHLIIEGDKLRARPEADKLETFPAPATINFDGSNSNNPLGGLLTYDWDFGDGNTTTGESPSHTYLSTGTYTVTLSVTNSINDTDTDSIQIYIGDNIDEFPNLDYDDDNDGIPDSIETNVGGFTLQLEAYGIPAVGDSSTQTIDLSAYGVRVGQEIRVSDIIGKGDLNGGNESFRLEFNDGEYNTPSLQTGFQCSQQLLAVSPSVLQEITVADIGGGIPGIKILGITTIGVGSLNACPEVLYQLTLTVDRIMDVDGDGIENHLDLDSDNDGVWDIVEAGGIDNDKDAMVDQISDQGSLTAPPNSDGDALPNFADIESSNDKNDRTGLFDMDISDFGFFDTNSDGSINNLDSGGGKDDDRDGLDDLIDGNLAEKGAGILGEGVYTSGNSVARKWNEVLLEAIRNDLARPTVHARNLHHVSAAMYDAWAVYDNNSLQYFLGNTTDGFNIPFAGVPNVTNKVEAQKEAMSFAAYRLIRHRFRFSPSKNYTHYIAYQLMIELGYAPSNTSTDYQSGGPAELGNYIAEQIIAFGQQDGSEEDNDYANTYYNPVNDFLEIESPGNPNLSAPNRWQPIAFDVFIDQSGNLLAGSVPPFLSPEWGNITPFALRDSVKTTYTRDGDTYQVYRDPGSPPQLDTLNPGAESQLYQEAFSMVAAWSSHLDPSDGVMWDISPASLGNIPFEDLPTQFADHDQFYDFTNGGVAGNGRTINPKTNAPYQAQMVPRGDYARVLAEFWADGPDSETPPGHWFTILNYVNDHPDFQRKWKGQGPLLSELEWDIKSYFTLGGTMHDAAIAAWSTKGWYDYIRPVSAIRYLAERGQSSNPGGPNYDPAGIPLYPGLIEQVAANDPLVGINNEHLGKIKIKGWRGPNYIFDPRNDVAGVDWILAENWMPYQRPTFVTPPFAGYVSGHSTFSRAAAEVMTFMTGDEYFPGGMGEFLCKKNEFLVFEDGPSVDVSLQWATYRDASDECSLSRIWGGIHPSLDDIPGRIMGKKLGEDAFAFGDSIINQNFQVASVQIKAILEGPYFEGNGLMDDFYRTNGVLPSSDPYGFNILLDPSVLQLGGTDAVVDWVRVEVRDANDSTVVVAEAPGLIQRDGDVIDPGGNPVISFANLNDPAYYVVLNHYNHFGVMTASPLDLSVSPLIDFTSPATNVFDLGGEATRNNNGTMTMWSGDANNDGRVNAVDKNLFWIPQNGQAFNYGSSGADFNLDGIINAVDLNFYWRFNNSQVEQLP